MELAPAFTFRYEGITRALITQVGVATPVLPNSGNLKFSNYHFRGLWDTGATNSVITPEVVKSCELQPFDVERIQVVGGEILANKFAISLYLPNGVCIPELMVTEARLSDDADLLIGMDVITLGDFALTNQNGNSTFSFRIPSRETIQFTSSPGLKISRNAPCPCGSGKKYKNCHGA